jgi:TMEM175 potassium channel family protein
MRKGRVEAFSDGVIAILITIMVLELKVPEGATLASVRPMAPVFLSYVLSFVFLGIYWNNHHHLFHTVEHVNGAMLWANLHLLFWLSLVPFATAWMGANHFDGLPTAVYGGVLFLAGVAYLILTKTIIAADGPGSMLARAMGRDVKGKASAALYAAAIPLAFVSHWIAQGIYIAVALVWLAPDRRIESTLHE